MRKGSIISRHPVDVRLEPDMESEVICQLDSNSYFVVEEKVGKFYKICTVVGVEGYCLRKHVEILD